MTRRVNRTMRQKLHALDRAQERYGLSLTHRELMALSSRVRGEGAYLGRGTGEREVWVMPIRGKRCVVAFDPERMHIVSFLPPTWGQPSDVDGGQSE